MKGEATDLFQAFKFKKGDTARSVSNPEVVYVVIGRLLPDRADWMPMYLVNHTREDATLVGTLAFEIELEAA